MRAQNADEVWTHVQEEWARLKDGLLQKLAESMVKRCKLVIKAKGWQIKY